MARLALATLYRSMARHRLFAILNVGGLALGIAVFVVLTLYVRQEKRFNVFPGSDHLWVLQQRTEGSGQSANQRQRVMGGELDLLRADFPDLVGVRYEAPGGSVRTGGRREAEDIVLIDPGFFRLFGWRAVAGDPARALGAPGNIVLTTRAARRWFGSDAPIGRMLPITLGGEETLYQVAAVVADQPANQELTGHIFLRLDRARVGSDYYDRWDKTTVWTFLRFPSPAAAAAFERALPDFLSRRAFPTGQVTAGRYSQSLLPLSSLHGLFSKANDVILAALLGVGVFTLAVAILNYVNLATAQSGQRAREVAIRKVLGATRRQLVIQFMGEAVAMAALAVLVGLSLAELALPWINALGGTTLAIAYRGWFLLSLPALALGIGMVAGFYPAILLSRHQPARVLAAAGTPGGGRGGMRLRRGLVVVQFAVALTFSIATAVMLAQGAYLARADIGFRRDGLLVAEATDFGSLDRAQSARLLAGLGALPDVTGVADNDSAPGWLSPTQSSEISRADDPRHAITATVMPTGSGYFEVYASRLVAGRLFDAAHGLDAIPEGTTATGANVVINRTALRDLGFARPEDAIGAIIGGGPLVEARIIGVIEDMRFGDPHDPQLPILYVRDPQGFGSAIALRYQGREARAMIAAVERRWREIAPNIPFQVETADESLADYYLADRQRAWLFTVGAVLSIAIGCIGLYGLAAFDTTRRFREIGIRKTLGASTADIMRLLLAGFMRPVLLANLIAWPIAYVGLRRWLAGFDDRVALSPLFFLGASGVALLVAAVTVLGQSWRVARAEPARALRHE